MTRLLIGDCREVMRALPAESVQCVVTSPPYFRLRNYGVDGQVGQEETPREFVSKLVEVFDEVRRVLRPDGTVWLNLGDSYYSGSSAGPDKLKPKDLIGIPWRVALALQDAGWYLRQDFVWAKGVSFCPTYAGSTKPEPVTDRAVKSHEYVFLLTKSPEYFYDHWAVKEPHGSYSADAIRLNAGVAGGARPRGDNFNKTPGTAQGCGPRTPVPPARRS